MLEHFINRLFRYLHLDWCSCSHFSLIDSVGSSWHPLRRRTDVLDFVWTPKHPRVSWIHDWTTTLDPIQMHSAIYDSPWNVFMTEKSDNETTFGRPNNAWTCRDGLEDIHICSWSTPSNVVSCYHFSSIQDIGILVWGMTVGISRYPQSNDWGGFSSIESQSEKDKETSDRNNQTSLMNIRHLRMLQSNATRLVRFHWVTTIVRMCVWTMIHMRSSSPGSLTLRSERLSVAISS
jgi:hypothetical protein